MVHPHNLWYQVAVSPTKERETPRERLARHRPVIANVAAVVSLLVLAYLTPGKAYLFDGRLQQTLGPDVDFETQAQGFRYTGNTENRIDRHIYYVGMWESEVLCFMRDAIRATSGEDGIFLDIGANTGQHAVFMAKHSKEVHAIEPFPPVVELLKQNIALNEARNVTVHAVGYSNEEGSLPFFAPPEETLGRGSFDPKFSNLNRKLGDLPLVIGDDHLRAADVSKVDVIKIDIEGYERNALEGLAEVLKKSRPVVVMEMNNAEGGFRNRAELEATFPEGYQFFDLLIGGLPDTEESVWSRNFLGYVYTYGPEVSCEYGLTPFDYRFELQRNVVAVPTEKVNVLPGRST